MKTYVRFGRFGLFTYSEFAILQDLYPVDLIQKVSVPLHLERISLFFISRTASKKQFFFEGPDSLRKNEHIPSFNYPLNKVENSDEKCCKECAEN